MKETPTDSGIPQLHADFPTLSHALDYAAQGRTGINFYERGRLEISLSYAELRERSIDLARRLSSLDVERGGRVALLADTNHNFHIFFFACQYAGLVPVPIPVQFRIGSKKEKRDHTRWLIQVCGASLAMAPKSSIELLTESTRGLNLEAAGDADFFYKLSDGDGNELNPLEPDELAYLQFTSGSTRSPRGVCMTQRALLNNLQGIASYGLEIGQLDRSVSWLPFYHDMGLVGFVLGPIASQTSVDYFSPNEFVMRPQLWLSLMSRNKATISFAPPFGYELCSRRMKRQDYLDYNLQEWRIAGVGADMIRYTPLMDFAELLQPCGLNREVFLACYGLAESCLAVSFSKLGQGLKVDHCDKQLLSKSGIALPPVNDYEAETMEFVKCGKPLPNTQVQVYDENGQKLDKRQCGILYVKSPSIMQGYAEQNLKTQDSFSEQDWLNTGDLAYITEDNEIVITGRNNEMLLINGKNIWPQDLEAIALRKARVRSGDALAFSINDESAKETAIILIQTKESERKGSQELIKQIKKDVYKELGINCYVQLVPLHTLPRTTSGKPSRSRAKAQFLQNLRKGFFNSVETADLSGMDEQAANTPHASADAGTAEYEKFARNRYR